jgi:hypothetical protein
MRELGGRLHGGPGVALEIMVVEERSVRVSPGCTCDRIAGVVKKEARC